MTARIKLTNATVHSSGNVQLNLRARSGNITPAMRAAWATHHSVLAVARGNRPNTAMLLIDGRYHSGRACASRTAFIAHLDHQTAA